MLDSNSADDDKGLFCQEEKDEISNSYWPTTKENPMMIGKNMQVSLMNIENYPAYKIRRFQISQIQTISEDSQNLYVFQYVFSSLPTKFGKFLNNFQKVGIEEGIQALLEEQEFLSEFVEFVLKVQSEKPILLNYGDEEMPPFILQQSINKNSLSNVTLSNDQDSNESESSFAEFRDNLCAIYLALDELISMSTSNIKFNVYTLVGYIQLFIFKILSISLCWSI